MENHKYTIPSDKLNTATSYKVNSSTFGKKNYSMGLIDKMVDDYWWISVIC